MKLYKGDCLIESDNIESGSVDLILTDLPYGTMDTDGGRKLGITGWDLAIEPKKVYEIANRILRKNGKMVLFSQEPYTSKLITESIPNVPFSYRMIWEKDNFANALGSKKAPVNYYEDIVVFSKNHENKNTHPLADYVKKLQEESNYYWYDEIAKYYYIKGYSKSVNNAKAVLMHYLNWNYVQFSSLTELHYERLKYFFDFDKTFEELKEIDEQFKQKYSSTFNLWEGKKYKSNILKYKKDYDGHHPTQKPVLLLEDLIKTFSNEGNTVVDLTMGSGSTGVACVNTKRNFIGIEQDEKYFEIAKQRINEAGLKLF